MYIDYVYYIAWNKGADIPSGEFNMLSEAASLLIYDLAVIKIPECINVEYIGTERCENCPASKIASYVKQATAWQVSMLYEQGGIDALSGFSSAETGGNERLGDYSVSKVYGTNIDNATTEKTMLNNGVPISTMVRPLLMKAGLLNQWAYAKINCTKGCDAL